MFAPYVYLAFVYLVVRLIVPLRIHLAARLGLALLMLAVCRHHLIQTWVFGTMYSPEIPRVFVLAMGLLYCAFVLTFLVSLIVDLALLVRLALCRGRRPGASTARTVRYAVVATGCALSAAGVYTAVQVPEVRRVEIAVRDLPPALHGFRLVQLSDLHISRLMDGPWVTQVVERSNALNADLVVITGDLIDGTPDNRARDVAPLAGLTARHGVIASLGNHEYYFGATAWTAAFERLGMRVLVNANTAVMHDGARLHIAGVTDPVAPRFGMAGPDTARALAGLAPAAPLVLLSHQPVGMVANARAGVDLQLSGHTHGGMIRGLDQVVKRANGGYVSGWYAIGGLQLYVSNGTGLWNGFPIRLGVPAEITEFVLKPVS